MNIFMGFFMGLGVLAIGVVALLRGDPLSEMFYASGFVWIVNDLFEKVRREIGRETQR